MAASPIAWVDGRIFTGRRWVEAILADGGRVVAAGTSAEIRRQRPTGTETIPMAGSWALPGLVDAHLHLAASVLDRDGADLRPSSSLEALRAAVAARALSSDGSAPLLGFGWDEERLREHRAPTRSDLDRWGIDRPLVLYRSCRHVAVLNSRALERLHLDAGTPDPPRGWYGREGGDLNGLVYEDALIALHDLEAEAFASASATTRAFLRGLPSMGLTTIVPMSASPDESSVAGAACGRDGAPVRLRTYVRMASIDRASIRPPASADGRSSVAGAKIVVDGSFGARTAWLDRPYSDAGETRGFSQRSREELVRIVEASTAAGYPVALHAIGDRAIAEALEVLSTTATVGTARIEHASLTPPDVLEALGRARPAVVVQPHFVPSDSWLPDRLGPERMRWTYAFRSLRARGLTVAGSSDAPIEPVDPWTGLRAAVAPRSGSSRGEELAHLEAIELYTVAAGRALGEPALGSLEEGAWADVLLVGGHDWETVFAAGAAGVRATFVGGVPMFSSTRDEAPREPAAKPL